MALVTWITVDEPITASSVWIRTNQLGVVTGTGQPITMASVASIRTDQPTVITSQPPDPECSGCTFAGFGVMLSDQA